MIKKLVLNNFGKFRGKKEFELSPVTVFYGENESGKTTIFDGLFYAICKPDMRSYQAMNTRYERKLNAEISPDISISDTEFLNLYAIRAGNIHIPQSTGNAEWLQKVKASLFSGGIDPAILTANLEKMSSNSGALAINREIAKLKNQVADADKNLKEKQGQRESILEKQKKVEGLASKVTESDKQLKQIEEKIADIKKELEKEDKIRERARLHQLLRKVTNYFELKEKQEQLSAFITNRIEELEALEKRRDELIGKGNKLSGQKEGLNGMEAAQNNKFREAEDKARLLKPKAEASGECLSMVSSFKPNFIQRTTWNPAMIAGSLVALVMALIAALFLDDTARLILVAGGILAAAALFFLARRVEGIADESSESKYLQPIKEKWRVKFPEDIAITGLTTLAGFKAGLDDFIKHYELARELAGKAENELRETKRLLEDINKQVAEIEDDVRQANSRRTGWLNEMGVNSRDDYLSKVNGVLTIQNQIRDTETELQIEVNSPAGIKMSCERKLNEFERDGIPESGRSDAEYVQLNLQKEELEKGKNKLNDELRPLVEGKAKDSGKIEASLGTLPDEIRTLEENIARLSRELEDKELDKKAAAMACMIFKKIRDDESTKFDGLKKDIMNMLSVIVPEERDVEVKSLDVSKFEMKDAGGEYREVEMLSHGTRDAFVFAAKLAMANKASDGAKLLVLDEPFLHFDKRRGENALKLLNQSFCNNGWQIILFTKEAELRDLATEIFPDAIVYELAVGSDGGVYE